MTPAAAVPPFPLPGSAPGCRSAVPGLAALAAQAAEAEAHAAAVHRELPAVIRALRAAGDPGLDDALRLGRWAGYTLEELGELIGTTRERVRQRVGRPARPGPYQIPVTARERLRALQPAAAARRRHTGRESATATAAAEYTRLLLEQRRAGASYRALGAAAGVTEGAIRARLVPLVRQLGPQSERQEPGGRV